MDQIFSRHNVIIAHCLTKEGGAGNTFSTSKSIYQRIDDVLTGQLELSCSTISKGDTLKNKSNFFGPVGIILKDTNVTFASPIDSGTGVASYGKRDFLSEQSNLPTAVNIENAILKRSPESYNEICINKYKPFGFFLCFDDIDYLLFNIGSELTFHFNTHKYNLPTFNLSFGSLIPSQFDQNKKFYVGNGQFNTSDIYI